MANPVLDKFFQERFGGQNPFGGAQIGGPPAGPGPLAGGIANAGMGGFVKPPMPAPGGAGEPPWITKAREARKRAKLAPQTGGVDPAAPAPGPEPGPAPAGPAPLPPPDPNLTQFNQGPRLPPGGLPGGYGGIMGGQNVRPKPPRLESNPMGPQVPKPPRDPGAVFGKTPGGGF